MFLFLVSVALIVAAIIALVVATRNLNARRLSFFIAGGAGVLAVVALFFSTFYANGVGEAKVLVNTVDRTVVGTVEQPGSGFKAPWVDFVDFDLFSQELVYAGSDTAPSYTGGTVSGKEITVTTGGVNGGSTRANLDASIVYSLDAANVADIYNEYKSQERFTQMVVEKTILSVIRSAPTGITAAEFRGAKKGEVADSIIEESNRKLAPLGVDVTFVNLQDPRFSPEVEASLDAIEKANLAAEQAEAEQRTRTVQAETKVIEAQAEADANAILSASLTPQVLQQRYIEALMEAAKGDNLIITDGGSSADVLVERPAN